MKAAIRALAAVVVTLLAGSVPARAADGVVKITGRITGAPRNGPSVASAESHLTLSVGERGSLALFIGDFDGALGAGQWPIPDWKGEHAWHVRLRAVSVFADTATLDVEWRRYDGKGGSGAAASDDQVITLRQGQRLALDLARSPSSDSQLVNAIVEIEASYVGDPDYEHSTLAHDVWLVHEQGTDKARRDVVFTTKPGDARTFEFEPIRFTLFTGGPGLQLRVNGEIRTRIRADGGFDVELKANRTLDCGAGTVGGGGVKTLTLKGRETVAVELPAASGYCTMSNDVKPPRGALPAGFQVVNGRVRVNFDEFFKGAKTSILITVRRLIIQPAPPREYR